MFHGITGRLRCARRRVGRRGTFLLFLAFLNFTYGPKLIFDPTVSLRHYNTTLPLPAWGWLWIAGGVIHLFCAFRIYDRVSFTVAAFVKGGWACMYADLAITQHYPSGWLQFMFWAFFAAIVLMIAAWPEPPHWGDGRPQP